MKPKTNTKRRLVDPNSVNNINYKKRSFKKGLEVIDKAKKESLALKEIDNSKLHYTFSV